MAVRGIAIIVVTFHEELIRSPHVIVGGNLVVFVVISTIVRVDIPISIRPVKVHVAVYIQSINHNHRIDDTVIIGCDTVVSKDELILGKPKDRKDASLMLKTLSGNEHQVLSGVALIKGDKAVVSHEVTKVYFDDLSEKEIEDYIASGESDDKAGAYGIQGLASKFVKKINGCYFNVVGLPVNLLYRMLKEI